MVPELGDFAVIPIDGPVGFMIRVGEWANGSGFRNYEHAEVYVGMADKHAPWGFTMGAYPGGARLKMVPDPARWQTGWLWSTGHISLTAAQRGAIVDTALSLKGTPYSWLDYGALAAHRLHLPVPGLKLYIGSSHSMICSQLVDYCYRVNGVQLFHNRWPGYVTPADLANLILGNLARKHAARVRLPDCQSPAGLRILRPHRELPPVRRDKPRAAGLP